MQLNHTILQSTGNSIVIWSPVIDSKKKERLLKNSGEQAAKINSKARTGEKTSGDIDKFDRGDQIVALREFILTDCEIWFVRFSIDNSGKFLTIGNKAGLIRVWNLHGKKSVPVLKCNALCKPAAVRMVKFSPQSDSLCAVFDNGVTVQCDFAQGRGEDGRVRRWKI